MTVETALPLSSLYRGHHGYSCWNTRFTDQDSPATAVLVICKQSQGNPHRPRRSQIYVFTDLNSKHLILSTMPLSTTFAILQALIVHPLDVGEVFCWVLLDFCFKEIEPSLMAITTDEHESLSASKGSMHCNMRTAYSVLQAFGFSQTTSCCAI